MINIEAQRVQWVGNTCPTTSCPSFIPHHVMCHARIGEAIELYTARVEKQNGPTHVHSGVSPGCAEPETSRYAVGEVTMGRARS